MLTSNENKQACYLALADKDGWCYDPMFNTYIHEKLGVFFYSDDVSRHFWHFRIVPRHHRISNQLCVGRDWMQSEVGLRGSNFLRYFWTYCGFLCNIPHIKKYAKHKCCLMG